MSSMQNAQGLQLRIGPSGDSPVWTGAIEEMVTALSRQLAADACETHQLLHLGWFPDLEDGPPQLLALVGNREGRAHRATWHLGRFTRRAKRYPSLAATCAVAVWPEREMWERMNIVPVGHPDLRPILHPDYTALPTVSEGRGIFHLPLGPVRADVSESGFFLFDTLGEQIMHMQPQLFFKHRGIEELGVGLSPSDAVALAERVSGTSTVAHATAFSRAVEQAADFSAPESVEYERMLFGELERLYNHAHDLAQLASASGMTVGQSQLTRVKEECLRLCGDLTGSRYLRGAIRPFEGTKIDWASEAGHIRQRLKAADSRLRHFVGLLEHTPTFVDRLKTTGIVRNEWAKSYGVVGPTARACGFAVDARSDYLSHLYDRFDFHPVVLDEASADAHGRFLVRLSEWNTSLRLIHALLDAFATREPDSVTFDGAGKGLGAGFAESPRGRVCHVIRLGNDGRINHWSIRAASAWNWPIFGLTVANGNIQTDFPVIDASFGLSYAGIDR